MKRSWVGLVASPLQTVTGSWSKKPTPLMTEKDQWSGWTRRDNAYYVVWILSAMCSGLIGPLYIAELALVSVESTARPCLSCRFSNVVILTAMIMIVSPPFLLQCVFVEYGHVGS